MILPPSTVLGVVQGGGSGRSFLYRFPTCYGSYLLSVGGCVAYRKNGRHDLTTCRGTRVFGVFFRLKATSSVLCGVFLASVNGYWERRLASLVATWGWIDWGWPGTFWFN